MATLSEQDQILLAFLETVDPESADKVLPPFDENNHVLLFFKYYNPRTKIMAYCGHHYVPVTKSPREFS